MTSVCLLDISNGEHAFPPIDKILADHGYELVDAQELLDARSADCLICISDDAFGGDNLLRWLSLVNRTKVDLLVTHRNSYLVPAQTYISIPEGAQHHASLSDKLVAYIEARLKALAADSYNIPRLMPVPEELRGEYIGGNLEDLLSLLSDPGKRVVGASSGLLHNISSAPITTRREYDIARFVRWSQDRLDTSFVKLSLRLAGGESTGATVTRDVVSLADVLGDSRSSNLIVLKGAPGAGKTLQLRFLETLFAINSIRNGSPDDGPLAFCVSLGEHAASASDDPVEWLRGRWARRVQVDLMQDLDFHLRLGRLHLLLDGFNEIPFGNADDRRRWMLRWRTVIHDYLLENVTNYVAVACRSRDLNIGLGTAETSQTTAEMMPLTESEIVRIAELRNPAAAEELELAITSDPSLIGLYRTPFSLADYLEFAPSGVPKTQSDIFYRRIASALRRERDRLNFRIFNERWLPDEAVTRLLEQGSVAGGLSILRAVPLLNALGCFARDLIQKGVSAARPQHAIAADVDQAVEALKKYLHIKDSLAANDALYAAVDLDLLAVSEDVVKFSHQTLQEFFAACALTDGELLASVEIVAGGFANKLGPLAQVLKTLGPGDELPVLPSTGFEEIFARASESRPGLIDKAVAVNPWLSRERCRMSDMDDVSRSRIVSSLIRELSRRWRATEDARERIACLDALGELGWHYGQNHSGA